MTEAGGIETPEWTPEQVAEFQRLWDEHAREFRHREVRRLPPYPRVARGSVIIEWPAPRSEGRPMPGWDVAVYDAATGAQMLNVMRAILVSAAAAAKSARIRSAIRLPRSARRRA